MRSRADALERCLVRLQAGDDLEELERKGIAEGSLARELSIAGALRREAVLIDAPSFDRTWERFSVRLHHPAATRSGRPMPAAPPSGRLVAFGAAVALIVGILMGLLPRVHLAQDAVDRAVKTSLSQEAQIHVRLADARLTDLVGALHGGEQADAPALARALSMERSAALALGADVAGLDRRIREEVPSALVRTPRGIASRIRSILGTLLPPAADGPEAPGSGSSSSESGNGTPGNGSPSAPGQPGKGSRQPGSGGGSLLPPLPSLPPLAPLIPV